MGEYAIRKSDHQQVKIGTCETMYYLRYEDRNKVAKADNSLDASTESNLFWRLPFPDEDNVQIGEYTPHTRGERLYKKEGDYYVDFEDAETVDSAGTIQLTHPSGLLVNVPCYHGEKLPESGDIKSFWNGKSWSYELAHLKNLPDGTVKPVVHCRHCGKMWRYEWEEILPYLHGELKKRLEKYAVK
jgi:hypothetical protein